MEFALLILVVIVLAIIVTIARIFATGSNVNELIRLQRKQERKLYDLEEYLKELIVRTKAEVPDEKPEPKAETIAVPLAAQSINDEIVQETPEEAVNREIEEELLKEPEQVVPPKPVITKVNVVDKSVKTTVHETATKEQSEVEVAEPGKIAKVFQEIKEWLLVGDKYRAEGVSKEFAIASNWLARIGIIIAVLGIGFGLRYSYKRGLIPPELRVLISTFVAIAMITYGIKVKTQKYKILANGFLGGGITVLYFSVFSASNFYHLISPILGLAVIAGITAASCFLSVRLNTKLAAILAVAGGYFTPVLISNGFISAPVLLTYMMVLGLGVFAITTFKNWYLVQFLAFAAHWTLFIFALFEFEVAESFPLAISFLTAYFFIFSFNSCFYHLKQRQPATIIEVVMLILNSGIFAFFGCALIYDEFNEVSYLAYLTLPLVLVYVLAIRYLLKQAIKDRAVTLTFLSLSSFFLAISIPLLFDTASFALCWSLQGLMMLWLSKKLQSRFLGALSYLLYGASMISLIFLMQNLYQPHHLRGYQLTTHAEYFKELWQHIVQIAFTLGAIHFGRKLSESAKTSNISMSEMGNDISPTILPEGNEVSVLITVAITIFTFIFAMYEVFSFVTRFFKPALLPAFTIVVIGLLLYVVRKTMRTQNTVLATIAAIITSILFGKVILYDVMYNCSFQMSRYIYPHHQTSFTNLSMRVINMALLLSALTFLFRRADKISAIFSKMSTIFIGLAIFQFLTIETNTYLTHFKPIFATGGISIVWSLYAIALLTLGIRKQQKAMRLTSLVLFTIVSIKIFVVDLANLGEFWRIIAFILLGAIIIAASFIYIKFQDQFKTVEGEE
jgi:uncharacterized membrane protein